MASDMSVCLRSDNGLSHIRCQAITWTKAKEPLEKNQWDLNQNKIIIRKNASNNLQPICSGLNVSTECSHSTWWRHQMETFSALLALCAGNSPVTGEFLAQSFDVFFDLGLNDSWTNTGAGADLRRYRTHYDVIVMIRIHYRYPRWFLIYQIP